MLHPVHFPSFITLPLENLDTAITPPTCPGWVPCSDPPSPMLGKHCSPGPHSRISYSSPQPPRVFCLIHLLLAPCLTCLSHTCDHEWDSSFPINQGHLLSIPWLRWQLTTWSVHAQAGQSQLQQHPFLIPVPIPQRTHTPRCTTPAAGHSTTSGGWAALTAAPLPSVTVLGIHCRHSLSPCAQLLIQDLSQSSPVPCSPATSSPLCISSFQLIKL